MFLGQNLDRECSVKLFKRALPNLTSDTATLVTKGFTSYYLLPMQKNVAEDLASSTVLMIVADCASSFAIRTASHYPILS